MQQDNNTQSKDLKLKVLCLQTNPKFKDVDHNLIQAEKMLSKYTQQDALDVIMFPETAFTGYCFISKEDIRPHLDEAGTGKTFEFCVNTAKRLNCYVICGYPELFIDPQSKTEIMYNSAYVVDRQGNLLLNYRKHLLYDQDYFWAAEGPGFKALTLKNNQGVEFKAAIAICMDIEPFEMKDLNEFRLAEFCKEEQVDVVFLLCAWPDREVTHPEKRTTEEMLHYWVNHRLQHLLNDEENKNKYDKKWAFFCANRVGSEGETIFGGSTCAFKCNPLELIGNLNMEEEGEILADFVL